MALAVTDVSHVAILNDLPNQSAFSVTYHFHCCPLVLAAVLAWIAAAKVTQIFVSSRNASSTSEKIIAESDGFSFCAARNFLNQDFYFAYQ